MCFKDLAVTGAFYQREAGLESKEILGIHIEP
jgi:hypothetical protein